MNNYCEISQMHNGLRKIMEVHGVTHNDSPGSQTPVHSLSKQLWT
jgi:hypothetical protein